MYAEFGSKQELFESVLEHYNSNHLTRVLGPLEAPGAGIAGIKQAFYGYASSIEGAFRGLGCLMCNTAAERGALDPKTEQFVAAYFERISNAIKQALNNAVKSGEVDQALDIDETAGFLTTALIGIAASVRGEAPPEQVWATYSIIEKMLQRVSNPAMSAP